jgi:hypothetical protein
MGYRREPREGGETLRMGDAHTREVAPNTPSHKVILGAMALGRERPSGPGSQQM